MLPLECSHAHKDSQNLRNCVGVHTGGHSLSKILLRALTTWSFSDDAVSLAKSILWTSVERFSKRTSPQNVAKRISRWTQNNNISRKAASKLASSERERQQPLAFRSRYKPPATAISYLWRGAGRKASFNPKRSKSSEPTFSFFPRFRTTAKTKH